jgi:hypothetical protein
MNMKVDGMGFLLMDSLPLGLGGGQSELLL